MIITSLLIYQFRNLDRISWEPHPRANLLLGLNAQGKTNILEALFLLGTTKTLRNGSTVEDLIQLDKEEALIRTQVLHQDNGLSRDLELQLRRPSQKSYLLNSKKLSPLSKIFGQLALVLFTPEDLDLIKAGPQARRLFLDLEISQASQTYLKDLGRYHRALKQRNAALRRLNEGGGLDAVHAFDEDLIASGCAVVRFRREAVAQLEPLAREALGRLGQGRERLGLRYLGTLDASPDDAPTDAEDASLEHRFRLRLRLRAKEERARGGTLSGPHRDDLEVTLNGRPARLYASQGQQRSLALALKLAEVQYLQARLGEPPVLLLDDVLSELDLERQGELLRLLDERVQTFVTSTHARDLAYRPGLVLRVHQGRLEPET